MRAAAWLTTAALLAATPLAATAQRAAPDSAPQGEVLGAVLDAESGVPLSGAVVLLEPRPGGAISPSAARSAFWATGVTTTTDNTGGYRFTRIPAGEYRLVVRRLGYRPAVLELALPQAVPLRVSVGLVVHPILLEPEEVEVPRALFASALAHADDFGTARLETELFRQRNFIESDVHVLTQQDVVDAVTLGETDLFRALHRLPSVTTRDDFTAELWTRGAPWNHTRVYFDGLPLFSPLHTGGVFTGINPDAVGGAFFHPGVRSVSIGEGAAGVLDLSSRAGGAGFSGSGELSVVSGRVALDGPLADRGGWMVAGRRSYVDLLSAALLDSANQIPYAFLDLTGRADIPLGQTAMLEVSGLWERDEVRGNVRDLLRRNEGHWGNALARATVVAPLGPLYGRHTVGISKFSAQLGLAGFDEERAVGLSNQEDGGILDQPAVTHDPSLNEITYVTLRSRFEPAGQGANGWAAGYQLSFQDQSYEGPTPRPYPVEILSDSIRYSERRSWVALWAEQRQSLGPVSLRAGLRTELSAGVANAGPVVVSPRLSVRYAPSTRTAISVGAGQSYQYIQGVAPAGPGVGPELHLTEVLLTANDTVPAIRSDVGTLGGETWLGDTWLGSVNLYLRRATGVTIPDPTPGVLTPTRPVFVSATNRAQGVELSLRRLAGRWTGSLSYSHASSRLKVDTLSFPAPTERRHALDLTAMLRVSRGLRLGAAFSAASGAPFTRYLVETVPCDSLVTICADTILVNATSIEEPGAARAPAYVAVDLLADWTHVFATWSLGIFVQLRNAIDRRGAVTYVGSQAGCPAGEPDTRTPRPGVCDVFDRGLPLLPLVGVSVRF